MSEPTQTILPLDHRLVANATRLRALLMAASAQEAATLQIDPGASAQPTVEGIQASTAFYLGALRGDELVGALCLGPDDEPGQITIASLVVDPRHQRRGIATALLSDALRRTDGMVVSVVTAADNAQALALYGRHGFAVYRSGTMGDDGLAVVKLRRLPGPPAT